MVAFSLFWPLDLDGYRIEKRPAKKGKGRSLLWEAGGGTFIVRNGGRLDVSRDRLKMDGLYRCLAESKPTAAGALDFVSRYGFLSSSGAKEERVDSIVHEINVVRSVLATTERNDWSTLERWVEVNARAFRLGLTLKQSSGDRPTLFFKINTLREAIYFQLLADVTGGAKLKKCARPGCPNWFKYGPGTKHRETAIYCSPTCQKAHAYMKSKEN